MIPINDINRITGASSTMRIY